MALDAGGDAAENEIIQIPAFVRFRMYRSVASQRALRICEEAVWLPPHMGDSVPSCFFAVIITDVIVVILLIVTSVEELYCRQAVSS